MRAAVKYDKLREYAEGQEGDELTFTFDKAGVLYRFSVARGFFFRKSSSANARTTRGASQPNTGASASL